MKEDRFESLMRDAAQTFRKPPEPDLDGMWAEIERETWGASTQPARIEARGFTRASGWLAAATLVIGIGLGRASSFTHTETTTPKPQQIMEVGSNTAPLRNDTSFDAPYDAETSQYLGQTAALLIALPAEARSGKPHDKFVCKAAELLTRTRLLLDSPAANDTQMRSLLEDLELVLAQVVRLQNGTDRTEVDLINRALEQRDVISRLRTAAADISAN
jgi:hypothetical protein